MINNTLIEKIVFTSDNELLTNDICNYLKNIVNNNKLRNIVLEITNKISVNQLNEIL